MRNIFRTKPVTTGEQPFQRPTRDLGQFFEWLKANADFEPSVSIEICPTVGTPEIYAATPESLHFVVESRKDVQAALMDLSGTQNIMVLNDPIESDAAKTPTTVDALFRHRLNGLSAVMRVGRQGKDNEVLLGAKEVIQQCEVVIIKAPLYKFRGDDQLDFHDLIEFMHEQRFVVFDILSGMFKPSNKALGFVELAFAKEKSPLRPNHYW